MVFIVFRGVNEVTLDSKGRLSLPARFRSAVSSENGGMMVVTIDIEERCLLLYCLKDWDEVAQKIADLPHVNNAARTIQRLLIGHAADCEVDAQGRILLPSPLRDYAKLEKDVVLVGQGKKFEIWDAASWQLKREEWLRFDENEQLPVELKLLSL